MSITLRILTKKSTLNFGTYKDVTVDKLIGMKKQKDLVSIYFKLSKISFNEEILNELGITGDWVIKKPSTDRDKFALFMTEFFPDRVRKPSNLHGMAKFTKELTKSQLQNINHGK